MRVFVGVVPIESKQFFKVHFRDDVHLILELQVVHHLVGLIHSLGKDHLRHTYKRM